MLLSVSLICQNLVQNGDFESYKKKEKHIIRFKKLDYWYVPNNSTPDLYSNYNKSKDLRIGMNWAGNQIPYSGESFIGLIAIQFNNTYEYREYITNELKHELIKDSTYCFSMYISLSSICGYAINNIGVHLSKEKTRFDFQGGITPYYTPSIPIIRLEAITETSWVKICINYKATGGEKYLTIGNFDIDNAANIINVKSKKEIKHSAPNGFVPQSYYCIDNVTLVPFNDSFNCNCTINRYNFTETVQEENDVETDNEALKTGDIFVLNNIYFETGKSELLPESTKELELLVSLLETRKEIRIKICGHTDNVGGDNFNIKLSESRAKAVVNFLKEKCIKESRLEFEGFGCTRPIESNETNEGKKANRRVEFEIL